MPGHHISLLLLLVLLVGAAVLAFLARKEATLEQAKGTLLLGEDLKPELVLTTGETLTVVPLDNSVVLEEHLGKRVALKGYFVAEWGNSYFVATQISRCQE